MTNAEKLHKRRLADIGCMVCRRLWGINDGSVYGCTPFHPVVE